MDGIAGSASVSIQNDPEEEGGGFDRSIHHVEIRPEDCLVLPYALLELKVG